MLIYSLLHMPRSKHFYHTMCTGISCSCFGPRVGWVVIENGWMAVCCLCREGSLSQQPSTGDRDQQVRTVCFPQSSQTSRNIFTCQLLGTCGASFHICSPDNGQKNSSSSIKNQINVFFKIYSTTHSIS